MSTVDALGNMPVSVAIDDRDKNKHDGEPSHPHVPWSKTVHVRAARQGIHRERTLAAQGAARHVRGPRPPGHALVPAGSLGVTSIELLPIQAKQSELFLQERGRHELLGVFARSATSPPKPRTPPSRAQEAGAGAVRQEVIDMVRAMHEAGFEVIMDVVYNHTCEAGPEGPTICWRGLDDLSYYRRTKDKISRLYDTTGCGNTLDFTNTHVTTFAVDSLRYWAKRIGIDGFRFDLAATLARLDGEFTAIPPVPVRVALRSAARQPQDDHGTVGIAARTAGERRQFGIPFAEWNDRFRDCTRTILADRRGTCNVVVKPAT